MQKHFFVRRIPAIVLCTVAVIACLTYSHYRAELPHWWRSYGGGIPYVFFWATFGLVLFPTRKHALTISIVAVLFTCGLEVLQLWHPGWLTQIRQTKFGAALLGSGFTWSDFPPYFLGGLLGYVSLVAVARPEKKTT